MPPQKRVELTLLQMEYIVQHVACGGVKKTASTNANIPYRTVMDWFKESYFADAVHEAEEYWFETLRANMMQRAMKKSDVLGMFFMKARYPELYHDEVRAAKIIKEKNLESRPASIILNFRSGPVPARLENAPQFLNGPDLDDDEVLAIDVTPADTTPEEGDE